MKRNFTLRVVFILLLGLGFSVGMNAQVFSKGDKVISLGYSLAGLGGGLGDSWGSTAGMKFPPLSGSFEYGVVGGLLKGKGSVGIGGYLGYEAQQLSSGFYNGSTGIWGFDDYNTSYLLIGVSSAFHYNPISKLDLYASLLLGYMDTYKSHVWQYNESQENQLTKYNVNSGTEPSSINHLMPALNIGARYYFINNVAAFAEVGFGRNFIGETGTRIGVSFKFR